MICLPGTFPRDRTHPICANNLKIIQMRFGDPTQQHNLRDY